LVIPLREYHEHPFASFQITVDVGGAIFGTSAATFAGFFTGGAEQPHNVNTSTDASIKA
jgi:hypothetical protein